MDKGIHIQIFDGLPGLGKESLKIGMFREMFAFENQASGIQDRSPNKRKGPGIADDGSQGAGENAAAEMPRLTGCQQHVKSDEGRKGYGNAAGDADGNALRRSLQLFQA